MHPSNITHYSYFKVDFRYIWSLLPVWRIRMLCETKGMRMPILCYYLQYIGIVVVFWRNFSSCFVYSRIINKWKNSLINYKAIYLPSYAVLYIGTYYQLLLLFIEAAIYNDCLFETLNKTWYLQSDIPYFLETSTRLFFTRSVDF